MKTATEIITPAAGVYEDVPDAEYRAWKATSNSVLSQLREWSPMHVRYWRENPPEPTEALTFGAALHCRVLTPDIFEETVLVAEQCCASLKTGAQCKNAGKYLNHGMWFCGVHEKPGPHLDDLRGKLLINEQQREAINHMADAINRHPAAREILSAPGPNEVSCRWDLDVDGKPHKCKGRMDGLRPTWETVIDIKTTDCARSVDFTKSIGNFGYYRQGAFYVDGLAAARYPHAIAHFVLIVVEKTAPYGVATFRLQGDALEAGREELRGLVKLYANCERNNYWPSYPSEFEDITVPAWTMRELLQQR